MLFTDVSDVTDVINVIDIVDLLIFFVFGVIDDAGIIDGVDCCNYCFLKFTPSPQYFFSL